MTISFPFAYFFDWGWIVAIITACSGSFALRKLIKKKIDDYEKSLEK